MSGRPRLVRLLIILCALLGASGSACTDGNPTFSPGASATARDAAGAGEDGSDVRADQPRVEPDSGSIPDVAPPVPDTATPVPDAASPTPDTGTTANLLAHFHLDQPPPAGGNTLTDPLGNTAVLNGPVTWPDDGPPGATSGRSLAFSGNCYVDLTLAPSRQPRSLGPKTVALWFKGTDPGPDTRTLIALFNQSRVEDVGLLIGVGATKIEGWAFGRGFRSLSAVTATPRNVWHHVAYTFANGVHVLYVDGAETSRSTTLTLKGVVMDIVKLGTYDETREPSLYQGLMRDVRIYDDILSPAEIRSLAGPLAGP